VIKQLTSIFLVSIFLASCGIYSFTGASIPADAETVSVAYFTKKATNTPATLNQTLTEGLRDLFINQTKLNLTEGEADLSINGQITKYQVKPMAIKANETAVKNRLTIAIKVKYNNSFDEQQNFESTFSRYRDFNSTENLADVEDILIEEITKELLEDVYNKAFVNW
tara:strand:- start:506 stop:1006 length:501 start_codon:yes stop_codon:yes gene_type:complete